MEILLKYPSMQQQDVSLSKMAEAENASSTSVTDKIRDQIRRESGLGRLQNRQKAVNRVRKNFRETEDELKVLNVMTHEEIAAAVAKIKQGNQTSHLDLRALKQALNDPKNITTFLRVTGSLQAVIGHLTGRKALHQLEAAYICCNLATGNEFACETVATAAGSYLIEYLDSQNTTLQVACLWTLGNLGAGSPKSQIILQSQGLIRRLITCLRSPHAEVLEAALYTFCLMLKSSMKDSTSCVLSYDEKKEIARIVVQLNCCKKEELHWLSYLLSCTPDCDEVFIDNMVPEKCISELANMIQDGPSQEDDLSALRSTTALVRITANLSHGHNGLAAMMVLSHQSFPMVLNHLLRSDQPHLSQESAWLASSLLHHSSAEVMMNAKKLKLDEVISAKEQ